MKKKRPARWFVYILECGNGHLYTGITVDVEHRLKMHRTGKGARFTKIFGVKQLLFTEKCRTRQIAMKREAEIKTWPRGKKFELIQQES